MAVQILKIESILEGHAPTQYLGAKNTFNTSIAIDPDLPVGSNTKASGIIMPVVYEKFSGTELTGAPMWILPNNKTNNTVVYTSTGLLHSFNSSLAMRTADEATTAFPITITGGAGNGGVFYNNFYYLAEPTDISQYGGMDQGASIAKTENVWTGGKFGLSALTNTTYPSIQGIPIPNHPSHVHTDNSCYWGDVVAGQGVVHRMNTKKVTIEGDTKGTVVPSAFNALDLPFGYYPTDFESYGTDLVIAAIQTTDSTINQGNAALFFWDPTNTDTFYRQVNLPDPLVTALKTENGILHCWSGNANSGVRISKYIGGETVQEEVYIEDGVPPFAGAVDALGGRLVWGSNITYPSTAGSVMAFGSKNASLPKGIHNIVKSTSVGATPDVTSVKYVQQASSIQPKLVVGWHDASLQGLDKFSTTATYGSVFRSQIFNINKKFKIRKIRVGLAAPVDSTTSIVPKLWIDDESTSSTLATISNTLYNTKRKVLYKDTELKSIGGENNFILEFTWAGTTKMPILLPIDIEIEIQEDETNG